MNVLLFGASGMVGQGVLHTCLEDSRVERILVVTRKVLDSTSPKVEQLVRQDFLDWSDVEDRFAGFDTCFFCLGVSSVGMDEARYRAVTYDITMAVALMLERVGSLRTFIYVSGAGTNAQGRQMWARVKGQTESALLLLPFRQIYCFRPGYIQPMHGVQSKTGWYNAIYKVAGWMYPVLRALAPKYVITTDEIGTAMIGVSERGFSRGILESVDIRDAAKV
ncbi:NAD(P)H-binding [Bryocella elongata]|uniref:NAD(P)H-binding n=1 Tax=Bryocella elongata TaxID=863522 RepID=A0A1H5U8D1_9BACT|nr:NAD(P)H-binding protein [Bryocella elongata]SEF71362.1 NAD(P)H-binding [Bryocella elongata]